MLAPLDLKLLRDIGKMKGQTLAVSVVMACGLAMMIMSRSLILSLESTRDAYYAHHRFADLFCDLKRAPNAMRARPGRAIRHEWWSTRSSPSSRTGTTGTTC